MAMNPQEIRGLKPESKPYKKADAKGLYLLVKPNGSKLWNLKYRFGGKEKKMPLGAYPEVSLMQARKERDRARVAISDGIDPNICVRVLIRRHGAHLAEILAHECASL